MTTVVNRVRALQRLPVSRRVESTLTLGRRARVCRGIFIGVEGTIIARRDLGRVVLAIDIEQAGVTLEIDERQIEMCNVNGCGGQW